MPVSPDGRQRQAGMLRVSPKQRMSRDFTPSTSFKKKKHPVPQRYVGEAEDVARSVVLVVGTAVDIVEQKGGNAFAAAR